MNSRKRRRLNDSDEGSHSSDGESSEHDAKKDKNKVQLMYLRTQREAFDQIDNREQLEIWARDVSANSGAKEYTAASNEDFWKHYSALKDKKRYHYEIIREKSPCFAYWDLDMTLEKDGVEVNRAGTDTSRKLTECVIRHACTVFTESYGSQGFILKSPDFLVLDSTSERKISIHIIAKPRRKEDDVRAAWVDNKNVKAFVEEVNEAIEANEDANNIMKCKKLVKRGEKKEIEEDHEVVDISIYSKNRAFRLYMSSKRVSKESDRRELRVASFNTYPLGEESDEEVFMESLVCNIPSNAKLLECAANNTTRPPQNRRRETTTRSSGESSGTNSTELPPFVASIEHHILQFMHEKVQGATLKDPSLIENTDTLSFYARDYRYCERIRKQHNSNNGKMIVELRKHEFWYFCFDESEECRKFRKVHSLPDDISREIDDWFDDLKKQEIKDSFPGCNLIYPPPLDYDKYLKPPASFDYGSKSTHVWISGKGTGKTKLLKSLVEEEAVDDRRVLAISSHRTMARFLAKEYDLECYLDKKSKQEKAASRFVVSLESLPQYIKDFINPWPDVLILDEIETLLRHYMSSTMVGKRYNSFTDFELLVEKCNTVLVADADFGERGWCFLSELRKEPGINIYFNPPKKSKTTVSNVPSVNDFRALIRYHAHKQRNFQGKEEWKPLAIVSNSKEETEKLERIIQAEDPDAPLLHVNSDTKNYAQVKAFIDNPREEAIEYKYLIFTPAIGPGVDIYTMQPMFCAEPKPVTHFHDIYAYATPMSSCATDFLQQVGRIRSVASGNIYLHVHKYEENREVDLDAIRELVATLHESLAVMPDCPYEWVKKDDMIVRSPLNDRYVDLWIRNLAEIHRSQNNYMGEIVDNLSQSNMPFTPKFKLPEGITEEELVEFSKKNEILAEQLKEEKENTEREKYRRAEVIDQARCDDLKRKKEKSDKLTEDEKYSLEKFYIMQFWSISNFPDLTDSELDFYRDKKNKVCQENFENILLDKEDAQHLDPKDKSDPEPHRVYYSNRLTVFNDVLGLFGFKFFDDTETVFSLKPSDEEAKQATATKLLDRKSNIEHSFSNVKFASFKKLSEGGEEIEFKHLKGILEQLLKSCGLDLTKNVGKSYRENEKVKKRPQFMILQESVDKAKERTVKRLLPKLERKVEEEENSEDDYTYYDNSSEKYPIYIMKRQIDRCGGTIPDNVSQFLQSHIDLSRPIQFPDA